MLNALQSFTLHASCFIFHIARQKKSSVKTLRCVLRLLRSIIPNQDIASDGTQRRAQPERKYENKSIALIL